MNQSTNSDERLPGDVVVLVPTYNVGDRLKGVLDRLQGIVETVIVVDDGSTDGCVDAVRDLPVNIVTFEENRGKGHALVAGYSHALEDPAVTCVAVVDADGQHDPAELPAMVAKMRETGADFVIGAREFGGAEVPWRSRFGNLLTISLTAILLGTRIRDTQSGYRLVSRRYLEEVLPSVKGGRYETEMELLGKAVGGGYRIETVPIRTIYEEGNTSSHFHKVRDSFLIYRTLFTTALKARLRR